VHVCAAAALLLLSCSVMSDHNRSGRMDDGYSKAPSTADLDNLEVNCHIVTDLDYYCRVDEVEACWFCLSAVLACNTVQHCISLQRRLWLGGGH
jgi:hypothetical protein